MKHMALAAVLLFGAAPMGAVAVRAVEGLDDQAVLARLGARTRQDAAIERGLAWLRQQGRADGSVGERMVVASTALAVIAHLAAGVTPDDAQHGPWLRAAIGFVLANQSRGYFGRTDGGRMYTHGIATLMLGHALGMCRDVELESRLRAALTAAVAVTVTAAAVPKPAEVAGGWRYEPDEASADMSQTGWQLMSLHAAHSVGIEVPDAVIADAVAYVRRQTRADGAVGYDHPGDEHPALRGVALLALGFAEHAGSGDEPLVPVLIERIRSDPLRWQGPWFFYRAYYDAVAASRFDGDRWHGYAAQVEQVVMDAQREDGAWPPPPGDNEAGNGPVYMTSMAVLALGVGKQVLPAYQR